MGTTYNNSEEKRFCNICTLSLTPNDHGNRKSHPECAYRNKKLVQKEKYLIGNSAKLMIQKNEAVAACLYKMDKQKLGIPYVVAMEQGLKFDCPSTRRNYLNKIINMFDRYGYALETLAGEILIFIYHESDLQ